MQSRPNALPHPMLRELASAIGRELGRALVSAHTEGLSIVHPLPTPAHDPVVEDEGAIVEGALQSTHTRPRTHFSRRPRVQPSPLPMLPSTASSSTVAPHPFRLVVRGPTRREGEYSDDDPICIPSRWGPVTMRYRVAFKHMKEFHPNKWRVPRQIPIGESVNVWDRPWIVRRSTIHPWAGLGVFSLSHIPMSHHPTKEEKEEKRLFPYCGAYYIWGSWSAITKEAPSFARYSLSVDGYPSDEESAMMPSRSTKRVPRLPRGEMRFIDGDPVRSANIAGYINSVAIPNRLRGVVPRREPNVEWVLCDGAPVGCSEKDIPFHILTVPIRTIRPGDEILASYSLKKV